MKDLPKAYEPQKFEDEMYAHWNESGFFNPDTCIEKGVTAEDAESYAIVLPPPNVTGTLHLGHAVMLAIQDVVTRFHRMLGKKTLWLPGTDHAAIATQSKVEKILLKEEGKTRHDLGRATFLKKVDAFAQNSHDTIVNQMKKMGASVDWSREAFTLDEPRTKAVRTAFKKMYDDGLIYRGHRIVNWDPNLKTTVSDDEVDYIDAKGKFYYFKYGPFEIGTARPETKFSDKYIVMHPDDERYAQYEHGQKIQVEWINGPIEATIIKDEVADMEFGTGVMTITPWHSDIDFELAQKYNLDKEQIIDFDGKLLPVAGEFAGMHIKEAREKIVEKLDKKRLLIKIDEQYEHRLAKNSRGGGTIEPQIKEQWFIDVNKKFNRNGEQVSLKSLMQNAVRLQEVEIIPERFNKIYFHWIDNLRDWCISRQIWYGHQIPAWYCESCKNISVSIEDPTTCECGGSLTQDEDTLDTWFSAGLWTFSTLGWPDETKDLKTYHPTQLLETGYDILFFWVARMILMSTYLLDEVPFSHVYLHGLIRDEKGRKMSKSLDNIMDPLIMCEKFGTDATRLSLMVGIAPGNDAKLSEEKVAGFRNFTNKLYNISRYVLTTTQDQSLQGGTTKQSISQEQYDALPWEDQWIIGRLTEVSQQVTSDLNAYNISRALDTLKQFTWTEFADWYIEIAKVKGEKDAILRYCLETLLKLWHPAMPFVTEHIWSLLGKEMLMVETWPTAQIETNTSALETSDKIQNIISTIRNLRAESNIPASTLINVSIEAQAKIYNESRDIITKLCRIGELQINDKQEKPEQSATAVIDDATVYVLLDGAVDTNAEKNRLTNEIGQLEIYIEKLEAKLSNEQFVKNAPENIVSAEKEKLEQAKDKVAKLQDQLSSL